MSVQRIDNPEWFDGDWRGQVSRDGHAVTVTIEGERTWRLKRLEAEQLRDLLCAMLGLPGEEGK